DSVLEIHRSLHLKLESPFSQSIVNEVYDTVVLVVRAPDAAKAPDLNQIEAQALGMGLGTFIRRAGVGPEIVTG
ncbi:hypothetical protein, partial [Sinorhizobium meliloti]|uniref:hypothetical protein n=1 Tax=Rhizobium meliloti TaxID=382 RepID=UPI001AECE514